MSPLSDDYIRSLEPETLRYDVTIFDDFVISVLPNGIKTWAFLYDFEGRKRRKTLGVYPDMSYAQAEDALDNVRGMIAKLGDDIKDSPVDDDTPTVVIPQEVLAPPVVDAPPPAARVARPAVLATRRRYRQKRSRTIKLPITWVKPLALGLALIVGLGALIVIVPKLNLFSGSADTVATKPTPGSRAPAKPILLDDSGPKPSTEAPATDPDETPPGVDPPTQSEIVEAEPTPPRSAQTSMPDPPATRVPEPVTAQTARDAPAAPSLPDPDPDPAPVVTTPTPVATSPSPAEPEVTPSPERVDDAPPASAAISKTPAPVASVDPNPPQAATSIGGQVSRAVITSSVQDLEPVDDLGANVALVNGGYQTVFYFTELRNFTAGNIVHRWTVNGKVIADVPLRVGGGWRWRTYSSKDLLPGLTGDWSVAVVDGNGNVLGEQRFRFDR